MKADIKWFVEIIQAEREDPRVEVCESRQEARAIAAEAEARVDFDPATDRIAIYRGKNWAMSKLYE
jgi:hypothetical protein